MNVINEFGYRQDARKPDQIRNISYRMGAFPHADGSAYLEQGGTKVACTVFGPHECRKRSETNEEACIINAQYSMATFSVPDRRNRPRGDRRGNKYGRLLEKAFESVISTALYKRSQIDIFCEVLEADGGNLAACVNAVSLAIADAGISVRGLITAVECGSVDGVPCADMSSREHMEVVPRVTIGTVDGKNKIVLLEMKNVVNETRLPALLDMGVNACKQTGDTASNPDNNEALDPLVSFVKNSKLQAAPKLKLMNQSSTPIEQSTLPKINSDKLAQSILQIAINESSSGPKKQLPYTLEGLKTQILALNEEELVMLLQHVIHPAKFRDRMNVLLVLASNKTFLEILAVIYDKFESYPRTLSPWELRTIIQSAADFSFYHAPLVHRLKCDFLNLRAYGCWNASSPRFDVFEHIVLGFSRLRVEDRHLWSEIASNISYYWRSIKPELASRLLNSCAAANVDKSLLADCIAEFAKQFDPQNYNNERSLLGGAHTLAMYRALTPNTATSVLNYLKNRILEQVKRFPENNFYDYMRLMQICAAAKYELESPQVQHADFVLSIPDNAISLALEVKYVNGSLIHFTQFKNLLHSIVPLDKFCAEACLHETGSVVEGQVLVDKSKREFVSLDSVDSNTTDDNITRVAVLFLANVHTTVPENGQFRLIRQYPMNIRHLRAANLHPVVFVQHDLDRLPSDRDRCDYIRERLLNVSADYPGENP
ncbi:3' exoribonuclease family, domain 1 domain-containing protein [Ditylenchus destructor]|uniref:Putative exosome complex component RRP41 n=1 Tax=Ditylenchus destructor TaxID=166010 RepID=A0AAD4RCT1_9BILA|nr:3' exoribonuclease family, domain 1 domain-containing protein [Ditylenchus destructor]